MRELIRQNTTITSPPLVPELRLHLVTSSDALWRAGAVELEHLGIPYPFWAFCWPGGHALARYVLDHPERVVGKRVLDLGCGCGVAGIAAARGGALVECADIDPHALVATELNAELNGCALTTIGRDVLDDTRGAWDVILAADVCYDRRDASRMQRWLEGRAGEGAEVLLADPLRGFVDVTGLRELARYTVPTAVELEDVPSRVTVVFAVQNDSATP